MKDDPVGYIAGWHDAVYQARQGDTALLAFLLRKRDEIPSDVREFVADVVDGKIRISRPKRTYTWQMTRYAKELQVVLQVESEMLEAGRQRDKSLRTALTRKWAAVYRTTPANVERYLHQSKSRRT